MGIEKTERTRTTRKLNNKNEEIINQMIGKYSTVYPINSVNLKAILK